MQKLASDNPEGHKKCLSREIKGHLEMNYIVCIHILHENTHTLTVNINCNRIISLCTGHKSVHSLHSYDCTCEVGVHGVEGRESEGVGGLSDDCTTTRHYSIPLPVPPSEGIEDVSRVHYSQVQCGSAGQSLHLPSKQGTKGDSDGHNRSWDCMGRR